MHILGENVKKFLKQRGIVLLVAIFFLLTYISYVIYYGNDDSNIEQPVNSEYTIGPVQSNLVYSQNIYIKHNNLEALAFQFGTYQKINNGIIIVELYDGNKSIFTQSIKMSLLEDNQYYTFFLDKSIKNSAGKDYIVQFKFELEEEDTITLYCGDSSENSSYRIQGVEIPGIALTYKIIYEKNIWEKNLIFGILMICLILFLMIYIEKKEMCNEKLFIVTFIPISILFLLSNSPFNVPDEIAHFCRAFEISEGYMVSKNCDEGIGRELPLKDINFAQYERNWEQVAKDWDLKISEEKEFKVFWNTALYAPISYAPQALGIFVARLYSDNFWIIFYLGRLFNVICITILFYYAIKISPMGKEIIYLIAMIPMNIHEAVSYSPDGMLLAIICFIVSYVMYLRYTNNKILTLWHYLLIYFLVICVALYKVIYLPICLTFLLIPCERFKSKKKFIMHGIIAAVIALCMAIGWLTIANDFVVTVSQNSSNMSMQLNYIIHNPFEYYMIFVRTIFESSELWIMTMLGSTLGWDIPVSGGLMLCYFGILLYTIFYQKDSITIKTCFVQIICTIEIILQFCLLLTTEYLSWTPVRSPSIWGVQGRYLLPMLIYLYYMRSENYNTKNKIDGRKKFNIILAILIINVCACFSCLVKCTNL